MRTTAAVLLAQLALAGLAACTGTEGYVLGAREGLGGTAGEASSEAGAPSDGGAAGEAGAGQAHEAGASARDACPSRFESACSPEVVLELRDETAAGELFTTAIPDAQSTLTCIARDVCNLLFRRNSEIRNLVKLNMVVEDYDGISGASAANGPGGVEGTIRTSSRYLQRVSDAGANVERELLGILYYQTTNLYQYDDGDGVAMSWLVEGVAMYTRHAAGYLPEVARRPGGKYDDGGVTTGFFLIWLDQHYPDFVYELNQSLTPDDAATWSSKSFEDITGHGVDDLWDSYQAASF